MADTLPPSATVTHNEAERVRFRELLQGKPADFPAEAEPQDYGLALLDVIADLSTEMAVRLYQLQGEEAEDGILTSAAEEGRIDILDAALEAGWGPSGDFGENLLAMFESAYDDEAENTGIDDGTLEPKEEWLEVLHWLVEHGVLAEEQMPHWYSWDLDDEED